MAKVKLSLALLMFFSSSLAAHIEYTGDPSSNFPIRWAFQTLCDHHFDYRWVWESPKINNKPIPFNPEEVKPGDLIFVRDAEAFFREKVAKIKVPFFILTHGEYLDKFEKEYFSYLKNKKILAWFTIHPCSIPHERVIPLPLGIVQYKDLYDKREKQFEKFMRFRKQKREKFLYINFNCWHNSRRQQLLDYFKKQSYCTYQESCPFKDYIEELSCHTFVLSPPGLGPDCYRVWESLLVGTIPIVEHSHMDSMYEGLPVLFVDDLMTITPEFLQEKYKEMTSRTYNQEKLTMEYWIDHINDVRKKYWPQEAGVFRKVTVKELKGNVVYTF